MNWLWVFPAVIVFFFGLGLLAANLFRNKRIPHRKTPKAYGIAFKDVNIPTANGGTLYGWWIPGEKSKPVLILIHGWNNNLGRFMPYIRKLNEYGYNLLVFDARSHGHSSDLKNPTVWTFTEDALAAARFLKESQIAGDSAIGIIGHSIGGGAAINASSKDSAIRAVVSIGGFAHPIAIMKSDLKARHIPYFPFAWLFFQYYHIAHGIDFDRIAPVGNIPSVKGAILLIHGSADVQVPLSQAKELERAANPEKARLWILEEYGHNDCHHHPDFWQTITAFIDQNVK